MIARTNKQRHKDAKHMTTEKRAPPRLFNQARASTARRVDAGRPNGQVGQVMRCDAMRPTPTICLLMIRLVPTQHKETRN